jgi:hypothetical protein
MESISLWGPVALLPGASPTMPDGPVIAVAVASERFNEQLQPIGGSSEAETDDRGIYRIYGLPAGKYLVSVYDPGRSSKEPDRRTFYRDANEQTRATGVMVQPGAESTGIDIRLEAPQQTYRITGRLVAQDSGKPSPARRSIFAGGAERAF